MITQTRFRRIVQEYIMPLVAGTRLTACRKACLDHVENASGTDLQISLNPVGEKPRVMLLSRTQQFMTDEIALIRNIIAKWAKAFAKTAYDDPIFDAIAERCQLEAIAEYIDPSSTTFLLGIIGTMGNWASQTYEGKRINFVIGVDQTTDEVSNVSFRDFASEDFPKVLTSGYSSLIVCNAKGNVLRHETLYGPKEAPAGSTDGDGHSAHSPLDFIPIADWTKDKRYTAVLNTEGEILLFQGGALVFARRRGKWIFFTHAAYLAGMGRRGQKIQVRNALYQTMLDVSFKRAGGCLGLWRGFNIKDGTTPIMPQDRLDLPESTTLNAKNRFFRRLIQGRKFQELSRRLRQELVSVDGATVLLFDGTIVSVGAILRIDGGSPGGGRTAAAMELAKHGIGVKISDDGKISYWKDLHPRKAKTMKNVLPKYEIG